MPGPRLILITGCSGGGKSTLLAELGRRGHATVPEPGRRIVEAESDPASPRLPWNDPAAFARAAAALARDDLARARGLPGPVFFDRGLLDAELALAAIEGVTVDAQALAGRYERRVFLAPPWPELFRSDAARRHGLQAAIAEYDRIAAALPGLGYAPLLLPKLPVAARADFVLSRLADAD